MSELLPPDPVTLRLLHGAVFGAALALVVLLQRVRPYAGSRGSVVTNVGLWAVGGVITGVTCGACGFAIASWAASAGFGVLNVLTTPLAIGVLITIFALDLVSYLWHRANHVVPLLWRFHQVHHSDVSFTATTALRFHPGELLLSLPLRLAAIALLGAPVAGVVAFDALFALANVLEHGDVRLPTRLERRVDRVVITPALHRFHHTRAGAERDHNFGTIFAFWDALLRTYRASCSEARIEVGLPDLDRRLALWETLVLPARTRFPARS